MTTDKPRLTNYALLTALILLAFFLRVWRLPETPPGLWYDEAYYSMDAAWLLDGGPWQIFFAGNNGREPIFIYLQALFIWLYGATPLTSRLIAPLAGTLTVPLVYALAARLSRGAGWPGRWAPLLAAAGLTVSFWHIGLSRGGYRGVLLPLATALVFYLFWRAWQEKSVTMALLAGLALGASQYTYLAARALPLVFALFAVAWTLLLWLILRRSAAAAGYSVAALGAVLAAMALVSAVVFAPLGWIFYQNPALFSSRTGDVLFTPDTPAELATHLWQAVRLFIDAGDPNWRHHLPGRPMLGWLGWLGFWPGLIFCLRHWRKPASLFLLSALLVLYLPALLSTPPVHALRLSALLPVYFVMFALGLAWLGEWASRRWFGATRGQLARPVAAALAALLLLELGLTGFDYFGRWATAEETYVEYNGPLVDFVQHVADLTAAGPVIIPFQIYVHPTTRYLLRDHFTEQPAPETLNGPAQLVSLPDNFRMLNVANIPELPAYAWLERRPDGSGVVYVSRPPNAAEREFLQAEVLNRPPQLFRDRFGRDLASFRTIDNPAPLAAMFTHTAPQRSIELTWGDQAQLLGYDVTPELAAPGQPVTVNLYWRSLTNLTFDQRLFLQLLDAAGQPINQYEGEAFREDMYRWRPDAILPTQHELWLGPDTPPGPYLVRLGFFDDRTGERLPLTTANGQPLPPNTDQIQLGLFYVSADGSDPRQPATPLDVTFGDTIRLAGVTLPDLEESGVRSQESGKELVTRNSQLATVFNWQTIAPTAKPMTVFLQLLNEQGEVVAGWDSQPLGGLYPTNLWSPGEVIADTFTLPLPPEGLPPGEYRLIAGLYDFETFARLPASTGGDFAVLAEFAVP